MYAYITVAPSYEHIVKFFKSNQIHKRPCSHFADKAPQCTYTFPNRFSKYDSLLCGFIVFALGHAVCDISDYKGEK